MVGETPEVLAAVIEVQGFGGLGEAVPECNPVIGDIDEKALYERNPFSSMPGVKAYLPAPARFPEPDKSNVIDPASLIDLTSRVGADGKLAWDVPVGEWTILRMGRRSTGANTRPAPAAGTGLEHDKFDPAALDEHFANYCGKLLAKLGPQTRQHGWTAVHLDSWEMGAQNWTPKFRDEFRKRRGYDPQPYFATFSGRAVKSVAESERFLWDMRLTTQELIVENYAGHLKELGRKHGLELSIEPYDMNPTADLTLGAVTDVPMAEVMATKLAKVGVALVPADHLPDSPQTSLGAMYDELVKLW